MSSLFSFTFLVATGFFFIFFSRSSNDSGIQHKRSILSYLLFQHFFFSYLSPSQIQGMVVFFPIFAGFRDFFFLYLSEKFPKMFLHVKFTTLLFFPLIFSSFLFDVQIHFFHLQTCKKNKHPRSEGTATNSFHLFFLIFFVDPRSLPDHSRYNATICRANETLR